MHDVAVIGAGASGIIAAISAARAGKKVLLFEKHSAIGKKILVCGSGRCNLCNDNLAPERYNQAARPLVRAVLARFGREDIVRFFKELGLFVYNDGSRLFPVTNQSASVVRVLQLELKRLGVPVETGFEAVGISGKNGSFSVRSAAGKEAAARAVIIASGAKTYPALGSSASLYKVARAFGHTLIEPVPAAVPLTVQDPLCQALQGQRIPATVRVLIDDAVLARAEGDLLFTKYGLSGTAVLDVSEAVSVAINRQKRRSVCLVVDMLPFLSEQELSEEVGRRRRAFWQPQELLTGLLPNKVAAALDRHAAVGDIVAALKARRFAVNGTRGWNEAEFTSGGIDVQEVSPSLESRLKKGLFFCGEILDVTGERGGFNLAWAWASGYVAGQLRGA